MTEISENDIIKILAQAEGNLIELADLQMLIQDVQHRVEMVNNR